MSKAEVDCGRLEEEAMVGGREGGGGCGCGRRLDEAI